MAKTTQDLLLEFQELCEQIERHIRDDTILDRDLQRSGAECSRLRRLLELEESHVSGLKDRMATSVQCREKAMAERMRIQEEILQRTK